MRQALVHRRGALKPRMAKDCTVSQANLYGSAPCLHCNVRGEPRPGRRVAQTSAPPKHSLTVEEMTGTAVSPVLPAQQAQSSAPATPACARASRHVPAVPQTACGADII